MKKTLIIAEIAQAHDGSLGLAHSYIDALADTGVDAVKFQTHIASAESSEFEPFRVKFSYEDDTRYDYWKRMEFTEAQWVGLKEHCEQKGMEFISSPFSNAAVDLLERLQVKRYKVGSGEVNNYVLLEKIARTGKPVIISSGMSSYEEIENAIHFFLPYGNHVSLLQCTTAYPTKAGEWELKLIPELKTRFNVPVGLSDHSAMVHPSIAAVTLGAEILEFHAVFKRNMFGPDAKASLEIDEIANLVKAVRDLETDFSVQHDKIVDERLQGLKSIFEKSLSVNKDLRKGDILTFDDLETKKPKGYGINAAEYKNIIGRRLNKNLKTNSFLTYNDIE